MRFHPPPTYPIDLQRALAAPRQQLLPTRQAPAAEPCTAQPTPRFPSCGAPRGDLPEPRRWKSSGRGGPRCARRYSTARRRTSSIGKRGGSPHAVPNRFSPQPTGIFCCLLRRFSRALQSTNLCFGVAPARLLRRPQIFAVDCWDPAVLLSIDAIDRRTRARPPTAYRTAVRVPAVLVRPIRAQRGGCVRLRILSLLATTVVQPYMVPYRGPCGR
jgi:hypothetical protein